MRTLPAAVEIRPGVFRPDWSVVQSPAAQEALAGRAARPGLIDKWLHALTPAEDRVWRSVLRLYADFGRPPGVSEISRQIELPESALPELLQKLEQRDLLARDPAGAIRYAYPFTETATGHRVTLGAREVNALCAIDALGTGAMCESDISIQSSCARCGDPIHVRTEDRGRRLAHVAPATTVVWYDFAFSSCAAVSSCPTISFFCRDDHLRQWLETETPRRQGVCLSIAEALEVGRAVFGPLLAPPQRQ